MSKALKFIKNPGIFFRDYLLKKYPLRVTRPSLSKNELLDRLFPHTDTAPKLTPIPFDSNCEKTQRLVIVPIPSEVHKNLDGRWAGTYSTTKISKKNQYGAISRDIAYWADKRGIDVHVMSSDEIASTTIDFNKVAFIWQPLESGDVKSSLDHIPSSCPIVIDYESTSYTNIHNLSNTTVGQHRIAFRNLFGGLPHTFQGTTLNIPIPEQQVPLIRVPVFPLSQERTKDTIVFDLKPFNPASSYFYTASILADIAAQIQWAEKIVGCKLNFYFTSFFDISLYKGWFESVAHNEWKNSWIRKRPWAEKFFIDYWSTIQERVIAPVESDDEYADIMSRCRLFITEHGDLADADILNVLAYGIPTLTYPKSVFSRSSGFQSSNLRALSLLDPKMPERIALAESMRVTPEQGLAHALKLEQVPVAWDFSIYEQAFMTSWDVLYNWATKGIVNKELTDAIPSYPWNYGMERDEQRTAEATRIKRLCEKRMKN